MLVRPLRAVKKSNGPKSRAFVKHFFGVRMRAVYKKTAVGGATRRRVQRKPRCRISKGIARSDLVRGRDRAAPTHSCPPYMHFGCTRGSREPLRTSDRRRRRGFDRRSRCASKDLVPKLVAPLRRACEFRARARPTRYAGPGTEVAALFGASGYRHSISLRNRSSTSIDAVPRTPAIRAGMDAGRAAGFGDDFRSDGSVPSTGARPRGRSGIANSTDPTQIAVGTPAPMHAMSLARREGFVGSIGAAIRIHVALAAGSREAGPNASPDRVNARRALANSSVRMTRPRCATSNREPGGIRYVRRRM